MATKAPPARVPRTGETSRLLAASPEGHPRAMEELLSRVYQELRTLAASMMAHQAPRHTLQPTALVPEAWLRLVGGNDAQFPDRAYFFAAARDAIFRRGFALARGDGTECVLGPGLRREPGTSLGS